MRAIHCDTIYFTDTWWKKREFDLPIVRLCVIESCLSSLTRNLRPNISEAQTLVRDI